MGFYDDIRLLEHGDALKRIEEGKGEENPPIHIRVEVTESCNFRCSFCHWFSEERRPLLKNFDHTALRRLNLDRLIELIDEFADMGVKALSFTGAGDPLVLPGIERALKRTVERGMVFGVTSNMAMVIKDPVVEALSKASWLRWSMNAGSVEVYDKINNPRTRKIDKVFSRVKDNVRRINRARNQHTPRADFNASYIVHEINEVDISNAAQLAKSLGVDSLAFRPDTPMTRQEDPNLYSPLVKELLKKADAEHTDDRFKVYTNLLRSEDVLASAFANLKCFYINHTTYIAANGDVYPCCYTRLDAKYVMGNILNSSFREFWNSDARKQHYKKLQMGMCPSCPYGRTNQALEQLYDGRKRAVDLHVRKEIPSAFI